MENKGLLYIVATPIGNLQDVTLRAIDILKKVSLVVCEDTRISSVLLNKYGIKNKLLPVNEFNEDQVVFDVIKILKSSDVALISDAGTPLISDPGYKIVTEAKKNGIKVIPIPGPSAVIAALSASGLPTDKFVFLGFLPKGKQKTIRLLEKIKNLESTIVIHESPHRIVETVEVLKDLFGDIEITLARELTKVYEEIDSKKASEWLEYYATKNPKGEFVILFSTK